MTTQHPSQLALVERVKEAPVKKLMVSMICRHPHQPRKYFDADELEGLGKLIREHGQLQPILVYRLPKGNKHRFRIIDGECRWRACQIIGKTTIEGKIIEVASEEEVYLLSVMANGARSEHTLGEQIGMCQRLIEEFGYSKQDVAGFIRKGVTTVNNLLRLLNLHAGIAKLLDPPTPPEKRVDYFIATQLVRIQVRYQLTAWKKIQEKGKSARVAKMVVEEMIRDSSKASEGSRLRPQSRTKHLSQMGGHCTTLINFQERVDPFLLRTELEESPRSQERRKRLAATLRKTQRAVEALLKAIET